MNELGEFLEKLLLQMTEGELFRNHVREVVIYLEIFDRIGENSEGDQRERQNNQKVAALNKSDPPCKKTLRFLYVGHYEFRIISVAIEINSM